MPLSLLLAKPNPPKNVKISAEDGFPTSLMVTWEHPIHELIFKLRYHIRYCQAGCSVWEEVRKEEGGVSLLRRAVVYML